LRFVFDTNVLVSALLISGSLPARVLEIAEHTGAVLYSNSTLTELNEVLSRPKFARYLDEDQITGLLARIHRSWQEVHILQTIQVCRDPKDDKFLELAVNGEASYIITGDKDLLDLHPFQDIQIITPASYLGENP
jgi:putative PIN family toxin of toxin-antitoxin system